jgi:hypothetical protein
MLHVVLRVFRDVSEIEQSNLKLEISAAQEHTPPLLQVLVLLLAFSYAYLTYMIKSQAARMICSSGAYASPITGGESLSASSAFQIFYLLGWALLQCQSC